MKELEDELIDVENYSAKTKYKNLNLPVTYRMSSRFSITSGLFGSALDTDLNLVEQDILEEDSPTTNLRRIVNQVASLGSISLNDKDSSFVEIELLPGVEWKQGDTIYIDAMLPLRIKLLQIPIILNMHYSVGKVEFLTHTGFSLDIFDIRLDDIELDLYNSQRLVSKDVKFKSLKDQYLDFSLYLGGGFRYKFTSNWNIGISAKWDILAQEYSRYEIGSYYRF